MAASGGADLHREAGLAWNGALLPALHHGGGGARSNDKGLVLPKESRETPSCFVCPPPLQQLGACTAVFPATGQRAQEQRAELAKPDTLAAAASLLAERIRLLSLSKPPGRSAAAPSHPVFRCHYLNTLLIRPWSTEVCSHWSSAHSTRDIYITAFPGGHDTTHGLKAPAGTCLLSVELSLHSVKE